MKLNLVIRKVVKPVNLRFENVLLLATETVIVNRILRTIGTVKTSTSYL